ncbi:Crp/Fnr family transcriptional regulator, partial [Candidatus Saccharibacteria bacterium]|nr:Crp/Fnr family transcriptional regulator [Candidatus Saccharibacteria bacterium]
MKPPAKQTIDDFFSSYPERHVAKGQILIHAGDDPPGVFYVASGQIKQYAITDSGAEIIVKIYKESAIVPLSWAVNRTRNNYFYECFSDVIIRKAPVSEVEEFLRNNPDFVFDLLKRAYASIEDLYARMTSAMSESARNRMLLQIIQDCKKYGVQRPDGSYILNLHENDIAARTGLT